MTVETTRRVNSESAKAPTLAHRKPPTLCLEGVGRRGGSTCEAIRDRGRLGKSTTLERITGAKVRLTDRRLEVGVLHGLVGHLVHHVG